MAVFSVMGPGKERMLVCRNREEFITKRGAKAEEGESSEGI